VAIGAGVTARARAFAPGRVNLIGEHTDYNQGLALPFAISEGVTVTATARPDQVIEVDACDLGEKDRFEAEAIAPRGGWRAYVRGAVAELQRAGIAPLPARLEIRSTLQAGAGLSSSAALEVALCLALFALADERPFDPLELARLCSRIEHDWVGARSGLLDQIAVLTGSARHATLIDFRSLEWRSVPLALDGHRLAMIGSGKTHALATSGYNERRAECERATRALGLESLRDATLSHADRLDEPLARRIRHVVGENARVLQAVAALERHDWPALGELLNASHVSLRDNYEVSIPAVEAARGTLLAAGALGARLIGGGFGGHVLGLFPPDAELPSGAREVSPGAGPRLLSQSGDAT
jgi:galactokinase